MANYNSFGNACQVGNLLFWGFNLADGPSAVGAEATPDQISITPLTGGLYGLSFTSGWLISNALPIDQIISYNVATLTGQALIKDATLTIVGTLAGSGASGSVVETLSPAVPGSPISASLPSTLSVNIDFTGNEVSGLAVSNRLLLVGGPGNSDSAHISIIENNFSQLLATPEPMTIMTLGAGLLLIGMARRNRGASAKGTRQ